MGNMTAGSPGLGFFMEGRECIAINRTGSTASAGLPVQVDRLGSATEVVTTADTNGDTGVLANFVAPATAQLPFGTMAIVDHKPIADNASGRLILSGSGVRAAVTGTPAVGTALMVTNGGTTLAAATTGNRIVGIVTEAASGGFIKCDFDGVRGFGTAA